MSLSTNTTKLTELKNKANNLPDQNPPAQLQEKTVTPSAVQQEVVPDVEYDGLSKVIVEAVETYKNDLIQVIEGRGINGEDITIPEGVTRISAYVFNSFVADPDGYTFQTNLNLPNSLIEINPYAIGETLYISKFPDNLESIMYYAFRRTSIPDLALPESLKFIGTQAFYDVREMKNIWISKNVASIESQMFYRGSIENIYTDASSKPSGWDSSFNIKDDRGSLITVHYNTSKEDFLNMIK